MKYVCDICGGRSCELKNVKHHLKSKKHKEALQQINDFNQLLEINHHHIDNLLTENPVDNSDTDVFVQSSHDHASSDVWPMLELELNDNAHLGFNNDGDDSDAGRELSLDWESYFLNSLAPALGDPNDPFTREIDSTSEDVEFSDISWYPFPHKEVSTMLFVCSSAPLSNGF